MIQGALGPCRSLVHEVRGRGLRHGPGPAECGALRPGVELLGGGRADARAPRAGALAAFLNRPVVQTI